MFTKSKIIQNLLIVCFVCFLLTVMCGIMYQAFNKPNTFDIHTKIMQDFLQAVDRIMNASNIVEVVSDFVSVV